MAMPRSHFALLLATRLRLFRLVADYERHSESPAGPCVALSGCPSSTPLRVLVSRPLVHSGPAVLCGS